MRAAGRYMAGNVWQWTTDWYQEHSKRTSPCCSPSNPRGGKSEESYDPLHAKPENPEEGTQGWLVPVRAELLRTLSSGRSKSRSR
jgi:formylglycine-generating enzyme required for sulfatase activity